MKNKVKMNLLTPKQKKVLDFLKSYFSQHGFSPSYKEIAEKLDLKSDGSVAQYLDTLEEKGYISRNKGTRQLIPITNEVRITEVPILGFIAAGNPIKPMENPEPVSIPSLMLPKNGMCYALRVQGNSMIDDGIANGDVILIKHQNTANNGETVVAITEKGATLKRYYKQNNQIRLEPRNKNLSIIYPTELEIRGKFIGLIRKE